MDAIAGRESTQTLRVANALVALHKEQFGRGPTHARADFAGPDMLVCVLEDAFVPAERKLVELGHSARVRDARSAYQAATADTFIETIQDIVGRTVRAFASGVDAEAGVVFENFLFEHRSGPNHHRRVS